MSDHKRKSRYESTRLSHVRACGCIGYVVAVLAYFYVSTKSRLLTQAAAGKRPIRSCEMPRWSVSFRSSSRIHKKFASRKSFACTVVSTDGLAKHTYTRVNRGVTEKWFIFAVATDSATVDLAINMCYSLLKFGITRGCTIACLNNETLAYFNSLSDIHRIPDNMAALDATEPYEWSYNSYYVMDAFGIHVNESTFRHVQAVVLTRSLIFMDVLHQDLNVWMLDADTAALTDPHNTFLSDNVDMAVLANNGAYRNQMFRAGPYSFPFYRDTNHCTSHFAWPDECHCTLNNGIVSVRHTETMMHFWRTWFDRMLHHDIGDPQHTFNKLLSELGLTLQKRDARQTIFVEQVNTATYVDALKSSMKFTILGIIAKDAYSSDAADSGFVHAVGIGGMADRQNVKETWLKDNGFWFVQQSFGKQVLNHGE